MDDIAEIFPFPSVAKIRKIPSCSTKVPFFAETAPSISEKSSVMLALSCVLNIPFSSITKSVKAIFAPSAANFNAIALPIPRAAPVTTATLPSNSFILLKFFNINV